mmetsp:Transcript_37625/g.57656  ORF Transcript_37625/g.57656 Transcript_37625/m.57656 type:complete len:98 (+) Transcript_37625:267-560(+)
MTRTTFCSPSLADGRDLLYEIIPKKEEEKKEEEEGHLNFEAGEWRPSMNLYELIQCIPEFIENTLHKTAFKEGEAQKMLGRFYLGLNYDYQQVWMQN